MSLKKNERLLLEYFMSARFNIELSAFLARDRPILRLFLSVIKHSIGSHSRSLALRRF